MAKKLTRRNVLAGTAAGIMILPARTCFKYEANSKVAFGIIGTGSRGCFVGLQMANNRSAHLAAICDLYENKINQAKRVIPGGADAVVYKDFNELLANPGIDAVLISTLPFQHPDHFEAAVKAKKHIYCEKPVAAMLAGVKQVQAAGAKADPSKTIQFGFQQRYSPEYLKAESIVRAGTLGDVKLMESYWILAIIPKDEPTERVPTGQNEEILHWYYYRETSGSYIVEQDCHGLDVLNCFSQSHPVKAVGTGGNRFHHFGNMSSDHHTITYCYPGGLEGSLISVKNRVAAAYRDVREMFFGAEGVLETSRTHYELHGATKGSEAPWGEGDLRDRSLIRRVVSKRDITIDAVEAFFKSITGNKPHNTTNAAVESTLTAMLGRMAYETKREVTWDELLQSTTQ